MTARMAALSRARTGQAFIALGACLLLAAFWTVSGNPVMAVAAGLAPLAVLAVLHWPFAMVLSFVVFSFFRIHEVIPALYPLHIPQMLALAALGSLAWNQFAGRVRIFWCREMSLFAIFAGLVVISTVLASNRPVAFEHLSGVFSKIVVMVFAIAWLIRDERQVALTSRVLSVAGMLVGGVALYNKINAIALVEGTRVTIGRDIGSMLGDPNDLALVLLFSASFSLALLFTAGQNRIWRIEGAIAYAIVFAAIIATQSRGGLLGILAVSAVFAYRRINSKALLITVALVAGLALFSIAEISDRASGGAHEAGIDESSMGRLYAWQAALRMALENPLSGVGPMCFYYNYFQYSDFWDGKNHAVHSTWLGVMAESGFLAFAVFIALIVAVMRKTRRLTEVCSRKANSALSYRPELATGSEAVFSGLIGFIVSGTFLSMGFVWPLYIILGLAIGINRCALEALRRA